MSDASQQIAESKESEAGKSNKMEGLGAVAIPGNIRSFVYLVSTLGFPIVAAAYTLIVLSSDLRELDQRVSQLATRIDERPMGIDRTTDFIIYITESMRGDIKSGMYELIHKLDLNMPESKEETARKISLIQRSFEGYVRPIIRKHKRFASRFPSVGGNIGTLFFLAAPAEDISEGHLEGYLTGQTHKDFGEALLALLTNNIAQFGHKDIKGLTKTDDEMKTVLEGIIKGLELEAGGQDILNANIQDSYSQERVMINKDTFLELSLGVVDSAVTSLQDQMLERVKTQSSDIGNIKSSAN